MTSGNNEQAPHPNDQFEELLAAYNKGDEEAAEQLWAIILDNSIRIVWKRKRGLQLKDGDTTHDVLSESILKLLEHGKSNWQWNSRLDVFNSVATVVRSVINSLLRSYGTKKRNHTRAELKEGLLAEEWLEQLEDHNTEQYGEIEVQMDRLKNEEPDLFTPVYLRYYLCLKVKDIADLMSLSRQMVTLRINKAQKLIRQWSLDAE